MNSSIGFIGLGSLGTPIALNLIESGHLVNLYNRTRSKAAALQSRGGKVCGSVAELAASSKIVFSIVSDDAALKSICEGPDGLIAHLAPGSIHISMSTILPQTASDLAKLHAQYEQEYAPCPVFGRPEAASARKLNFALSGPESVRKKIEPLLKDAGAAGIWNFGEEIAAANTVKLCGNFLIAAALEAIGESIHLAQRSGVDPQQLWSMLSQTLFNSPVYVNYSQIILQQKFEPAAFSAKLGLKDLNLVLQQANSVQQPMALATLLRENLQSLVNTGRGESDWSAISTAV